MLHPKGWVERSNILSEMKLSCLQSDLHQGDCPEREGGRVAPGALPASCSLGSSGEASVFSRRRRCKLKLEALLLEDAVEGRPTLGARKWPIAVATAVL